MAVEYSLLTWAGLGTTVTFTDAGDIVNFTAHGAPNGHALRFTTTGALPTGLTANTTYYLRQGADANKFTVYPTQADAIAGTNQVTFTGAGSGTNKVVGEYWASLPATDPGDGGNYRSRYGTAGSERVYANLFVWRGFVILSIDYMKDLVLEVQGKWVDSAGTYATLSGYKSVKIWSKIMGVRDVGAFHYGVSGNGYKLTTAVGYGAQFYVGNNPEVVLDGLEFGNLATSGGCININGPSSRVTKCIVKSGSGAAVEYGGSNTSIENNLILGGGIGIYEPPSAGTNISVINNLVTGCTVGLQAYSSEYNKTATKFVGNISTGNTKNWQVMDQRNNSRFVAFNNFGDSTDIKTVTFENSITPGILTCRMVGHTFSMKTPIRFTNGGDATPPGNMAFGALYYIKTIATDTFTLASTVDGTAIAYIDSGSGIITTSLVWDTHNAKGHVSSSDFIDYTNKNFRPAFETSPQVESITLEDGDSIPRYDLLDSVRPNYEASSFPNNKATAGPFEFDHGEGLAPLTVSLSITGMASGSEFAIYKSADMSEIVAPQATSGSYSGSYTYTGDMAIIVRVRKGTAATKYLPYEYSGTITAAGFSLNVSQIPDPIA